MKDFNNKPRFGGKPNFSRGSDRGFDRDRQMFKAKCDDCGNMCEVPFRPTGERPVYCNDCFGKHKTDAPTSNFGKREREFSSYEKPSYSKPAYTPSSSTKPDARIDELKRQLETVNTKLDKLINTLEMKASVASAIASEGLKEKKATSKKVVAKTAPKKSVKKTSKKK